MNRLTDKEKQVKLFDTQILFEDEIKTYWIKPDVGEENIALKRNYYEAINKLGQLEDVEDELGVNLYTIIKALNNGVWIKFYDEEPFFCKRIYLEGIHYWEDKLHYSLIADCFTIRHELPTNNYGKTWALTMEELKDE